MNRRKLAATWTAEGLIQSAKGSCTFWTFTTHEVMNPLVMGSAWNALMTRLRRCFPGLKFFRVLEPHASGTRWHLHVLFDRIIPIEFMRSLSEDLGWGHLWVRPVRTGETAAYLSKYLSKARRESALRGIRLFSCSRSCPGRVRVSDVEVRVNGELPSEICKGLPTWWQRLRALKSYGKFPSWLRWRSFLLSLMRGGLSPDQEVAFLPHWDLTFDEFAGIAS